MNESFGYKKSVLYGTRAWIIGMASLVLVCGSAKVVAPMSLSLKHAIAMALARNPQAAAAAAQVQSATALWKGAGALPATQLNIGPAFGKDAGSNDEDIILSQSFPLGSKLHWKVKMATANHSATIEEQNNVVRRLILETTNAYYNALLSDQNLRLAQEGMKLAQQFDETAKTQFQAGDVAKTNVLRSEIAQAQAQEQLSDAETIRQNQYAKLINVIGLATGAEIQLKDSLMTPGARYQLPQLMTLALQTRPDLKAALDILASREAALKQIRSKYQPDLVIEARHSTLDPTNGGNTLRAGFTFPLVDHGTIQSQIQAARADIKQQQAIVEGIKRAIEVEVKTAYQNYEEARQVTESFKSGRLQRSKNLRDMIQLGYEHGGNTYLELLDAQQVYLAERSAYFQALASLAIARAQLRYSVGGKLP